MEFILKILNMVLWGICVAFGFWIGHKVTNRLDEAWERRKLSKAGAQALERAKQMTF
jgi:hypothetical protein